MPDMAGLDQVNYLTNTSMLDLDVLPRHLVIVGGGYVALEFAQMYRRFGSEVTVVEKGPRLIQREDEEVSAAVQDILEAEGIRANEMQAVVAAAIAGYGIAQLPYQVAEASVRGGRLRRVRRDRRCFKAKNR